MASTEVGPGSCLTVYADSMTATTAGCVTATKACATGSEIEAVLVDDTYARAQRTYNDGTKAPAGVVVTF